MLKDCININDVYFEFINGYLPWTAVAEIPQIIGNITNVIPLQDYDVKDGVYIHKTAVVEKTAILKAPLYIGPDCYIGANACLRNGAVLVKSVKVGIGCEIKSSILFDGSAVAHFNFIGDSIIGCHVNFEAGSITANHYNERMDKTIFVLWNGVTINTHSEKFGALVGDHSKIGANAVLSPGTILPRHSIVKRLALIEQLPNH